MKQKTRIIIYIAIAVTALALGIIAVLSIPKETVTETADEFLNAGNKYLIELSYDKAVIEFNKAIEIEPRNADAYIGLAEAYLGMGDEDKAVETLELGYENTRDERIKEMLDELLGTEEVTEVTTAEVTTTAVETTTPEPEYVYMYVPDKVEFADTNVYYVKATYLKYDNYYIFIQFDDSGNVIYNPTYYLSDYDNAGYTPSSIEEEHFSIDTNYLTMNVNVTSYRELSRKNVECYGANGVYYADIKVKYNENDILIEKTYYKAGTDEVIMYSKYDDYGNLTENYNVNDTYVSTDNISYVYNTDGSVAENTHNSITESADDTSYFTSIYNYTYDTNGNCTKVVDFFTCEGNGYSSESKQITEYFYNDNNNMVKEICTDKDGSISYTVVYDYDSNGNVISMVRTNWNGEITTSEKYSYTRVKVLKSEIEEVERKYNIKLNTLEIEE